MIIRAGRSLRSLNTVYYEILNPLHEPDWNDRLSPGMGESIFNSAEWAAVLHESYGYRPCYVTSREADTRSLLIPMMEVDSWLTGRRGVSLPFSDFCAPVGVGSENITSVIQELVSLGRQRNWRYCEIRNDCAVPPEMPRSARYLTHTLDLAPSDAEQFGRLDGSVRTSIRKAVTSGVEVTFSVSLDSMRDFYKLNCETRRRHGLPPQPFRFFRNVHQHIIAKGLGRTVTAWHLGRPIAAALFFHAGRQALFKYGASDSETQHLRAVSLLMWEAIRHYAEAGFERLSMGRTAKTHSGLRRFKLGWGTQEGELGYVRYDLHAGGFVGEQPSVAADGYRLLRLLPLFVLRWGGAAFYRHMA